MANATYSETVTVRPEGPCRYDNYEARAWTSSNRQFRHEVRFAVRFLPHSYRVTVVANADDDALCYREFVLLKPRTIAVSTAETVYNFPREINRRSCVSTMTFDPFGRRKRYRAAIDLVLQANVFHVHLENENDVVDESEADNILSASLPDRENTKIDFDSPQMNNNDHDCVTKNHSYCAKKELLIDPHEINSHKLID